MNRFCKLAAIIAFFSVMTTLSDARNIRLSREDASYIDKFYAHDTFEKLSKENIRQIEFIEIISSNFGIINCYNIKKEYWTARILYVKGEVIKATKLLQKNNEDIAKALKTISEEYQRVAKRMIDDSIVKICELHIEATFSSDHKMKRRLIKNQDRIRFAYNQYQNAIAFFNKKQYVASVNFCRSTKGYAINVLHDLAEPKEKAYVKNKYRIDIVDNRNTAYKDG